MDEDIRDLLPDDLFDPFEDDDDGEPEASGAFDSEDGMIGVPLETQEPTEKPEAPPEERIAHLFESMPGQKKLLLRLIEKCRAPKTGEEMDEYTAELQEHCYSVYSPVILRELLQEAGAIDYLPAEGEDPETRSDGDEETASALHTAQSDASEGEGDPFSQGRALMPVDESEVRHEIVMEDGDEMVLDYLEVTERKPGLWAATEAGLAAVDEIDYVEDTRQLLEKEPVYLDIYHQILDFCAQEPRGRSAKEIDNLVNDSPLLQEPRRYSGYFVSRLEREGAVEWKGGWCITEAGQEVLGEQQARVEKEETYA